MSWKRGLAVISMALCLVVIGAVPGAWAQDWGFVLDRNISHVIVNSDGSADIEYWMTFTCDNGAHPIDIIDVGMPNDSYDLQSARAWYSPELGGGVQTALDEIYDSEWLPTGVEVHLNENTIMPGQQGTLHLRIRVREMVYPDEDEAYASVEFIPHYYDRGTVHGSTHLEIHFFFPQGVTNEETRYHEREFDEVDLVEGRIVFIYLYPDANGSTPYRHGISFPRTYVDQVFKAPVVVGSGSTSKTSIGDFIENFFGCGFVGIFMAVIFGGMILGAVRGKRRKLKYLPPSLAVEGVGVKRGLTAIEAAILLEKPLNKILTMILFGLVKKRALIVLSDDPLRLEKIEPKPQAKWRAYENRFLEAIKEDGSLDEKLLQTGIIDLIKSLNKKLKGFSRKETVAYYSSIVDRAWKQVTDETTPEVKSKYFDQGLEWIMMDDEFEDRTRKTFDHGPVFMPPWWAHYRPWVPYVRTSRSGSSSSSGGGRAPSSSAGGGGQVTLPTLPGAAFAGTVVGGMERTAGGIVSKLESFTSGITQRTNPPPKTSSSSGSSFKSGGCACACACACAGCACACAGGGR